MPAKPGAGKKRYEAEWLGRRRFDYLAAEPRQGQSARNTRRVASIELRVNPKNRYAVLAPLSLDQPVRKLHPAIVT